MLTTLPLLLLPALVVAAAASDVMTMRIPNWLNAVLALSMVPAALIAGMPLDTLLWHLLTGLLVLGIGFGLFAAGVIGGGDAKLMAAVALWIGWQQVVAFLIITALAGGVLAVAMKLWQAVRVAHEAGGLPWFKRVFRADLDLPYGVAIAAGCLAVYPQTIWLRDFT